MSVAKKYRKYFAVLLSMSTLFVLFWLYHVPAPQKQEIVYKRVTTEQAQYAQAIVRARTIDYTSTFLSPESLAYMTSDERSAKGLRHMRDAATDDDYYFMGAYDKDKMIGFVLFRNLDQQTGFVDLLFVLKEYSGKGIGTRLLEMSLNHFKINQPYGKRVLVNTRKLNKMATRFYQKHQFYKYHTYRELDYDMITMIRYIR